MKKLLVLSIASFIFLSFKKEKIINTNGPIHFGSDYRIYGPYQIYNQCPVEVNGISVPSINLAGNNNMELVWENDTMKPMGWSIEYRTNSVKFWARNRGPLDRQRVLDINWRNPNKDGSIDAVMWTINADPNQEWELKGEIVTNSSKYIVYFQGVIINKRTGQMLELTKGDNESYRHAIAGRSYYGSPEEKYFYYYGHFRGFCFNGDISTIWRIR
ncbi:MAG: hypothetical protein ACQPRJ_01765 [Solitalea-like symbiont of Acarus siro]